MARYIDAEEFLKLVIAKFKCVPLVGVTKYIYGEECFDGEHLDAIIKEIPTADVVEVVRCANCKNLVVYDNYCMYFGCKRDDDDFCSYGERKDAE